MIEETFSLFLDLPAHKLDDCKYKLEGYCLDQFVPKDFECLRTYIDHYENNCAKFTD